MCIVFRVGGSKEMTHKDSGKYAAKHPSGTKINDKIAVAVRDKTKDGRLSCAAGEKISRDLGVKISEVGVTADLLEIKINKCQLGLFGYGEKPNLGKDISAKGPVSEELKKALEGAVKNGEITCAVLWMTADRLGATRKAAASACDALKIKIRMCQLGAFQ
jgi:hypothetical protein